MTKHDCWRRFQIALLEVAFDVFLLCASKLALGRERAASERVRHGLAIFQKLEIDPTD